jgi:hypothetical protein
MDKDLLDKIEAMGADTVYFLKRGDGNWAAHVRRPGAGPSRYSVAICKTLRDAVDAATDIDPEIEDLL